MSEKNNNLVNKIDWFLGALVKWILYLILALVVLIGLLIAYGRYMPTNISLTRYQQYVLVNGVSLKPDDGSYEAYTDKQYLSLLNEVIESGYNESLRRQAINNMILVYAYGIRGESASVTNAYLYCKKEKALPKNAKLNLDCERFSPDKQESH